MFRYCILAAAMSILVSATASADTIFPADSYPVMHENLQRQDRVFYDFLALPFGWSLEANLKSEEDAALVNTFLAQTESEVPADVIGKHPYEMFTNYEEHGDLGMFGGVAVAGTAFRYMTLKRDGGSAEELAAARKDLVRAIQNQHVFWAVTGVPGVVARGIRRLVDENPEAPAIPDNAVDLIPLADDDGNPLPAPKNNGVWRADNSNGALPANTWIWQDACSKDQLVGQIFAMVLLYDAAVGDPDIDQSLITQMQADALATARMLMTTRDITKMEGPAAMSEATDYDLIIMDADGRPTYHHDINPYSLEKMYLLPGGDSYNIFNLALALGIMKGLYHVTGDADIETYVYQELMGNRGYLSMIDQPIDNANIVDYIYADQKTNFSNVNMIATGIWLALYTESDPLVEEPLQNFLRDRWWNREGQSRTAKVAMQPFYNMVWMGVTDAGVDRALADETAALLAAFPLGPYMNRMVENCDAAELEAQQCLAVDDETVLTFDSGLNRSGMYVSNTALDPSIRPPSNFDARSDPFELNGGGGLRLNPGGDLLAAYWMGRFLTLNPEGQGGKSPKVRTHMEVPGLEPPADASPEVAEATDDVIENDVVVVADVSADTGSDAVQDADSGSTAADAATGTDNGANGDGSGCSATPGSHSVLPLVLLLLGIAAFRLRRIA